jgi:hypothetical protein
MGGYVRMTDLNPELVAANVMDQQRYLQTIRQQIRGYAAGQDTDERVEEEGEQMESESDQEADDPMIADNHAGLWAHLVDSLREEINNALRREHFRDASELQNCRGWSSSFWTISGNLRLDVTRNAIL